MQYCQDCPVARTQGSCVAWRNECREACELIQTTGVKSAVIRASSLPLDAGARWFQNYLEKLKRPVPIDHTPLPATHYVGPALPISSGTAPLGGTDAWMAPLRGQEGEARWEGGQRKKPWQYRVTAVIPHLDLPDALAAVVATLRAQTEQPYILIVDTGSLQQNLHRVLAMEAEDLEVICLRPRAWRFSSEPVSVAMDCAFSHAQTEFCYATHVDVFLKRPDFLADLVRLCDYKTPAVGYQMSPRPQWETTIWRKILSHTATLYHMPSMRRFGVSWSMLGVFERLNLIPNQPESGFPDTEVNLGLHLLDLGVGVRWYPAPPTSEPSILMLGSEPNEPYENDNLQHVRSYTSHVVYDRSMAESRRSMMEAAIASAYTRIREWSFDHPVASPWEKLDPEIQDLARKAARCPHRREPDCSCKGYECGPQGHFPGRRLNTILDCTPCVAQFGPPVENLTSS